MAGTTTPRPAATNSPPADTTSLRPEDISVETFAHLPSAFHIVDEDPTDSSSGHDTILPIGNGHFAHV